MRIDVAASATSAVSCASVGACQDLYYRSVSASASSWSSALSMFAYSANVIARDIGDVDCMDDRHNVFWTMNLTLSELEGEIAAKYGASSGQLPCAGLRQMCGNGSCGTEYAVKRMDAKHTADMRRSECYDVKLSFVVERTCDACDESHALPRTPPADEADAFSAAYMYFVALVSLSAVALSIAAYVHSLLSASKVDDVRASAPMVVALECLNLLSDLVLCGEIFCRVNESVFVLIAGVGVLLFVVLRALVNLVLAEQMRVVLRGSMAYKHSLDGEAEAKHSSSRLALLLVATALSGSCWSSLLLLSSRLFGAKALSVGLTSYELMQLLAGAKGAYRMASVTLLGAAPQIALRGS